MDPYECELTAEIKTEMAPDFGGWSVDGGFKQMDKVPRLIQVARANCSQLIPSYFASI
jgi:hypothetical protein